MELEVLLQGFIVTTSLIIAIGAQNAYCLKLGLTRSYTFLAVFFCSLSDLFLISIGVYGLGAFIKDNQNLVNYSAIFGIVFLISYAFMSFKSAFKNQAIIIDKQASIGSAKKVIAFLFAFTYLNPHTYVDTILLIGGIGANVADEFKTFFVIGCFLGSFSWFSVLIFGARFLDPLFRKNITWKVLDVLIGCFMLYIAYGISDLVKF